MRGGRSTWAAFSICNSFGPSDLSMSAKESGAPVDASEGKPLLISGTFVSLSIF
jgi:hypothetical protein